MFYAAQILSESSLRLAWFAAHSDRRLQRRQVESFAIASGVDSVARSADDAPLRLTGQLMFGLVRLYDRKVTYLTHDAADALARLRREMASGWSPAEAVALFAPGATHQLSERRATAKARGADARSSVLRVEDVVATVMR